MIRTSVSPIPPFPNLKYLACIAYPTGPTQPKGNVNQTHNVAHHPVSPKRCTIEPEVSLICIHKHKPLLRLSTYINQIMIDIEKVISLLPRILRLVSGKGDVVGFVLSKVLRAG